jgi:Domain of unknown function (DUF5753)
MAVEQVSTICCFEPVLVPGLLQTRNYAAEVIRGLVTVEPGQVRARVEARLTRQGLLKRPNPPQSLFFIKGQLCCTPSAGQAL